MARVHQRVIAIVAAVLFLATSVGFSLVVIWQIHQDNQTSQQTAQQRSNMLQGTKLSNFTPLTKIDTLSSQDQVVGTGAEAKTGDTVTVHYTGAVASTGIVFQSSLDTGQPVPLELKSGNVIEGWVQGVPGMKVGGKRRLLIPASMAYGTNPPQGSGIAPNADLVFDIQLIKIGQ